MFVGWIIVLGAKELNLFYLYFSLTQYYTCMLAVAKEKIFSAAQSIYLQTRFSVIFSTV
jgi:hypothetical protein